MGSSGMNRDNDMAGRHSLPYLLNRQPFFRGDNFHLSAVVTRFCHFNLRLHNRSLPSLENFSSLWAKKKPTKEHYTLLWTWSDYTVTVLQAGLLTDGSPSGPTFPFPPVYRVETVAYRDHRPRLQRWPNVTDLHRIPFSSPFYGDT